MPVYLKLGFSVSIVLIAAGILVGTLCLLWAVALTVWDKI